MCSRRRTAYWIVGPMGIQYLIMMDVSSLNLMRNKRFASPRWCGRLNSVIREIARRKQLDVDYGSERPYLDYRQTVISAADKEEQEVIRRLETLWREHLLYERDNMIVIRETLSRRLVSKGEKDLQHSPYRERGLSVMLEEKDYVLRARLKMSCIILAVIFALISFCGYDHLYYKELRAYRAVVEANTQDACKEYYSAWPDGAHYEDVMFIEVKASHDSISVIRRYLSRYSDGKYLEQVNDRYDRLWDHEMWKYQTQDSLAVPEASAFMKDMLAYMKENRIHDIRLNIHPEVKLKDFHDYDPELVSLMEMLDSKVYKGFLMSNGLPVKGNVRPLKENFSSDRRKSYNEVLEQSLRRAMDRVFSHSMVCLSESVTSPDVPVIDIRYTICNQEEDVLGMKGPLLWLRYNTSLLCPIIRDVTDYYPGINIRFMLTMRIPGTDKSYTYSETGVPGMDNVNTVQNPDEVYDALTMRCFNDFMKKMNKNIGFIL